MSNENEPTATKQLRPSSLPPYEEPDDDYKPLSRRAARKTVAKEAPATPTDIWAEAMSEMTLKNIEKLAMLDTFVIAGISYRRKMLTPKARRELDRLQTQATAETDAEIKDDLTMKQAIICLEGMTPENFENTDIGVLEQVLGACIMASKGFRTIQQGTP